LRGKSWLLVALLISAPVLLPSCNQIINFPAPRIKALEPANIQAGTSQFTLTVTGFQFTPSSAILWNGSPLITYFPSNGVNELTALVPASLVANPGSVSVEVFTPQPGGGTSSSLIFTITPAPTSVPVITSISPTSVLAGSGAFELFITGTDFAGSSTVTVNGDDRQAVILNPTSIQAQITAADVASAGTLRIAVVNPVGTPDGPGGVSSPVSLTVNDPVPTLSSLSPTNFAAGTTANTSLQVNGSSFVPNSKIEIDGSAIATVFGGGAQLGAILTPGYFAAAGVHRVQVVNPPPGGGASNVLTYAVDPSLTHGLPVLLDYGYDGSEANQGVCGANCAAGPPTLNTAGPSISSDGSVVVYASTSTNLIKNQANSGSDIFSRTTCIAGSSCTPTTTDVSVGPNGAVSNGSSAEPSVDGSAAHVAFTSTASNLVAGVSLSPGSRQVYWMPICSANAVTGCSAGELVSLSPDGATPGNGDSYNPSISPDGRYVAFVSLATNLVSGLTTVDGKTPQVFLRDTCNGVASGCTPTTYLVSTSDGTTPGDGASSLPSVSNNGQYVSFTSASTNLGATAPNPNGTQEVFERTTCLPTVTTCAAITTLISTPDGVTPANGSSSESKVASGGRFVVFASTATNLLAGAGPVQQIYMYDTCLSAASGCVPGASLISTPDGSTPGNGTSEYPTISLGTSSTTVSSTAGEFVAFASRASNLSTNTANGVENIFVRKMCVAFSSSTTSCTPVTALASQPGGTSPPPATGDSLMPAISGNAHVVTFISSANNLVANDTNGFANLFLALTSF
jgi:trimeric autotransporter adhesin